MNKIVPTAAAAVLAALTLAACGSTQPSAPVATSAGPGSAAQAATSPSATPHTSPAAYPKSAKAGQFIFRVVSVRTTGHLPTADQTMTAPAHASAGQVFVIVKVAITNDGQMPQAADGGNLDGQQGLMRDSRGATFTAYDGAQNTSWVMGGNYNPGSVNDDDIVFEAPQGTVPTELSLPAAGYGENGQMVSGPRYLSVLLGAR
jgi:hypothetical protein